MIRMLIIDDHEMVREGLKAILLSEPDFAIVGDAAREPSRPGFRSRAFTITPNVLMPTARRARRSGTKCGGPSLL